jgi:hypothetical protein
MSPFREPAEEEDTSEDLCREAVPWASPLVQELLEMRGLREMVLNTLLYFGLVRQSIVRDRATASARSARKSDMLVNPDTTSAHLQSAICATTSVSEDK